MQHFHRLVCVLLMGAFLASPLAWVLDSHAAIDYMPAPQAGHAALEAAPDCNDREPASGSPNCNHGCHFASHLLGQSPSLPRLPSAERDRLVVRTRSAFVFDILEPLDRPPLASFAPPIAI